MIVLLILVALLIAVGLLSNRLPRLRDRSKELDIPRRLDTPERAANREWLGRATTSSHYVRVNVRRELRAKARAARRDK